jgi:hypothetical protein
MAPHTNDITKRETETFIIQRRSVYVIDGTNSEKKRLCDRRKKGEKEGKRGRSPLLDIVRT